MIEITLMGCLTKSSLQIDETEKTTSKYGSSFLVVFVSSYYTNILVLFQATYIL